MLPYGALWIVSGIVIAGGATGIDSGIAAAMAYFLSGDSEWVTGQVLSVNGGQEYRD